MSNKRSATNPLSDSDSDDDDFGPMPISDSANVQQSSVEIDVPVRKERKNRKLEHEKIFLDNLPSSPFYEKSYMHRDNVTFVCVAKTVDFIITGSCDGHIKFWKKLPGAIEFVKHFQAHLGAINSMEVSPDDLRVASSGKDNMLKIFDVTCYDMSNMITLPYTPGAICWMTSTTATTIGSGVFNRIAVADQNGPVISIYNADGGDSTCMSELHLHATPVRCMALNVVTSTVISIDAKGVIEYWSCRSLDLPGLDVVSFQYKTDTDLYELAKRRTTPCAVSVSPSGRLFAVTSLDKHVRVFDFGTGKLKKTYNETVAMFAQQVSAAKEIISDHDKGRRIAVEKELEASVHESLPLWNCVFDESGNFLIFGSLVGVKMVNLVTNTVKVVGGSEGGERFLRVGLYQGIPKLDMQLMLARGGSAEAVRTTEEARSKHVSDPVVLCSSFHKRRFYLISSRDPDEAEESRDVLNEKPTADDRLAVQETHASSLGKEAVLSTSMGDIHIKLFSAECPKTIENFTTHAKNGYYDNIIFHRCIKGFMIQTGDPLGDGTGGESVWGGEFEDEFVRTLRHDRPFTVSMANAGPNTNGSQFFITTVPTPWLDNKHTVFGRVTKGFEVVSAIENLKVNKYDRPIDVVVKILSVEIAN